MKLSLESPDLKGRRILVTGGSMGFGLAMVQAFVKDGARVATCGRSDLSAAEQAGAFAFKADVGVPGDVDALAAAVRKEFGGLEAVINNAAVMFMEPLLGMSIDAWKQTQEVNVTGAWLVTRAALPLMDGGCIVNVTSGLAWGPMAPYSAYCVSKAGLNMLTRATALELGERFRVNALDPGVGKTRMNPTAPTPAESVVPIARVLSALPKDGPTGMCFKKSGGVSPW